AGVVKARGNAAEPQLRDVVTFVIRSGEFNAAKDANVKALQAMQAEGRITVLMETTARAIDKGEIVFDTRDGELRMRCDRVIARLGSAPPRAFVEGICAEFEEKNGRKVVRPGTG